MKKKIVLTIAIDSKALYHKLIEYGILPNKTFILTFPAIPSVLVPHFIRGSWDGDGTFSFFKNAAQSISKLRACFYCASEEFILTVREKLTQLGGLSYGCLSNGRKLSRGSYLQMLSYGSYDAIKLYTYLYKDAGNLYLTSKRVKAENGIPSLEDLKDIPKNFQKLQQRNRILALLNSETTLFQDKLAV
jgi:hypothetical protein